MPRLDRRLLRRCEISESRQRKSGVSKTVWVALGLGVFGLSNFVMLGLAGRDLGPAVSAPVSVTWTFMNAVGIGLFMPLEQEVGRRTSAALANSGRIDGIADVFRYIAWALAGLLVVGSLGAVAIARVFLSGDLVLSFLLMAGLVVLAAEYLCRGILAGTGRFRRYGAQLVIDGTVRIALSALVFSMALSSAAAYGMVLVMAPLVATLATAPWDFLRSGALTRTALRPWPMAPLVLTSATSQLMANAGPLIIAALATDAERDSTGRFVAAITVARIPLFLFAAIQAVLLPAMSAHVARRDRPAFVAALIRGGLVTAALAVTGIVGIAVAGSWAIQLVYGTAFTLDSVDLLLLALSGGIFMAAQFLAQALLALHADGTVASAWGIGIIFTVLALTLPLGLTTLVATALCVGALAAVFVLALVLLVMLRRVDWNLPEPADA